MFNTIVQQGVGVLIIAAIVYLLLRLFVFKSREKYTWVDTSMFDKQLEKASEGCTEVGLVNLINFLRVYNGEYIKREKGKIIFQAYSNREKDALKAFYENHVIPSGYASVRTKEEYRNFIMNIGVRGVEQRPDYEGKEHKVTITGIAASAIAADKAKGKISVLDATDSKIRKLLDAGLDSKRYYILDKAQFKNGEETTKFDFFVVGENGAFALETGAIEELANFIDSQRTTLTIEKGDIWTLAKGDITKQMTSPTRAMEEQQDFLEVLVGDMDVKVQPILVLPDANLSVIKHEDLPYDVLSPRNIVTYIQNYNGRISLRDRMELTQRLNELKM